MDYDLKLSDVKASMPAKAAAELREYLLLLNEELERRAMARDEAKMEKMLMEEKKMMEKEKMIQRRRERSMMRHMRRTAKKKKKKISKSEDSESFTSDDDSDQKEMKEEVKRLMEKAIRETDEASEMNIEENSKDDEKIEDEKIEDERMFPRRRGRLIRYVRRHISNSQEEDFHIQFHHLQLPSDDEDDSDDDEIIPALS